MNSMNFNQEWYGMAGRLLHKRTAELPSSLLGMPMEFREIYPAGMAGYESGNILSLLLGESAWISLQ